MKNADPFKKFWLKNDVYTFHSIAMQDLVTWLHLFASRMEEEKAGDGAGKCILAEQPSPLTTLYCKWKNMHFLVILPATVCPLSHQIRGRIYIYCYALNEFSLLRENISHSFFPHGSWFHPCFHLMWALKVSLPGGWFLASTNLENQSLRLKQS